MGICYPGKYQILATGGAIGDALFFFASGFMLFRGGNLRFDNFMKRRISRIYPTVLIVAIVGAIFFGKNDDIVSIILSGGGWFVSCIMVYYAVIWFVKKYFKERLALVWAATALFILAWFYFFYDRGEIISIYGGYWSKWCIFFIFMLQGAVMGMTPDKYTYNKWVPLKLIACVALWYSFFILQNRLPIIIDIQWLSLLPLLGVTYYLYKLSCASFFNKLYNRKYIGQLIFVLGSLCLECYLLQSFFFTDKLNFLFPMNIPLIMLFILLISYGVNFSATALRNTFKDGHYQWKTYFLRKPE